MKWLKKEVSPLVVKELCERFGVDALCASIMARRGIIEGEDVLFYLENDPRYLHNPFLFTAMEDAVDRILLARDEGEKVLIFGDRDADGITGTALLALALRELEIDVSCRLPEGEEPYGLSLAAVEEFAGREGTLIVTVDNGISCLPEVARANELGVDVIIVDHHSPREALPEALVILNPKCQDSGYPFRDLAGCAVAYKLAQALRFSRSSLYKQQVCLLNVRPVNEAIAVEAVKLSNMTSIKRITEFLVPGAVDIEKTRLVPFLRDQQILVWDAPLQKKLLAKIFGPAVEIAMYDVRDEVAEMIPSTKGMSLLRLREASRIAKYRKTDSADAPGEIETFESLFVSYVQRKAHAFTEADATDLQLVALGTIADMMPLKDENRILVRRGLSSMEERPRPGIAELLYALGILQKRGGSKLGAKEVSWQVTPAINASGRMGQPRVALDLFLSKDPAEREALAGRLLSMNQERRQLGDDFWAIVRPEAEASVQAMGGKLALVMREDMHRGITGIMATKAAKFLNTPTIICALLKDGTLSGSMRSARGLDLTGLLESCADLFIDSGGHDYAAGFSMEKEKFPEFKKRLEALAGALELDKADEEESLDIDAELPKQYFTPSILDLAERFEPVGENSGAIVFMSRNLRICGLEIIGKKEPYHLKLVLDSGLNKWPAVYWQAAARAEQDLKKDVVVDAVFTVSRDNFNGADTPRLVILDAKLSAKAPS
jgi:single-stranded-DNA-specific exonuclease